MNGTEIMSERDSTGMFCCVCGKVVRHTKLPTLQTSNTCSDMCRQLLVFLQGCMFGNVVCLLACGNERKAFVEEISACYRRESEDTRASFDAAEKRTGVQSQVIETWVTSEADVDSSQDEDLLQVAFDEDCGARSDAGLASPISSLQSSPSQQQPPINTLQQAVSRKKKANRRVSARARMSHTSQKKQQSKTYVKKPVQVVAGEKVSKVKRTDSKKITNDNLIKISWDRDVTDSTGTGKKRVVCGTCGETFVETHLYVHMKAKHADKIAREKTDLMFPCTECDKKFEKQIHLNKHLAKKHPSCEKLTKVCTFCHKGFSNQIGLSVHMRHVHKALSPKECDMCEKTFKSCKELSRHKLRDHKLRVHICHLCGKNFAYSHALKSHLDAHAGVKKHFCEVCGEGFVRMTSLCGHRASAHSKKEDVVYKCDHCSTSFQTKSLLSKHLFEYHFTGPYAIKDYRKKLSMAEDQGCQACKDAKNNCGQCPLHASEDAQGFSCGHCGKTFSRTHYLKAHEKQHQEAKFSCDICCKRFTYKCNLKAHRSTHSNDKPFQCPVCSKKFRLKFLLEDHQRTHNRDLLYKCYICGRGLTRIPNLKRHIKVMHPEVNLGQHVFQMQLT